MTLVGKLLLSGLVPMSAFGLWKLLLFIYHHQFASPVRHLRGPKATSWIYGHLREIRKVESCVLHEEWVKQYGPTFKYKSFLGANQLMTMDLRAINHILSRSMDFQKPAQLRYHLSRILGQGLIFVEGTQHRQQRHILNPAFGPAQIRELTGTFLEKAIRLRDIWSSEIAKEPAGRTTGAHIDAVQGLNRMTLDVIGLAGFNYNFDSLNANEKPNELNEAFQTMFAASAVEGVLPILQMRFPLLRLIPTERLRRIETAQLTTARIGKKLLAGAKAAALENATDEGEIKKSSLKGRDLLSLLVKANMATDTPESQRLPDKDVLAQVPTFLAAGHETTSSATAWALFALMKAPGVQTKLREELFSIDTDTPSMDELMALPYLDAVVRETLRLHSPIAYALRVAMKDDLIPVAKPYTDAKGVIHNSIGIAEGDLVLIPILAINRSCELWGPDAREFKPERWENTPEAVSHIPGVWGHLLSFLGGPRACIGYRFSLVEIKALLFTLVRAFEFELGVPESDIGAQSSVVDRPMLRSDPERKPQLPMVVRPYKRG